MGQQLSYRGILTMTMETNLDGNWSSTKLIED
jgi:hypothetical protein